MARKTKNGNAWKKALHKMQKKMQSNRLLDSKKQPTAKLQKKGNRFEREFHGQTVDG